MSRILLAAILGLGLATSPVSAPQAQAQINQEQAGQLLAALAAIGVLGVAIDKYKDDRKDRERERERAAERERERQRDRDRYRDHRAERALPAVCQHRVETGRGLRAVYGKRCLQRHFPQARNLPRRCERIVHAFGRDRAVYGARCLQRQGWTVAQRH
ncbi:DUF3824 domain-containing protein [Palleronia pelagia]|uniref:Domain of unknwon function n=1 Tax=Palleronia pelagia TaxID=387096 RepID=A0A1H8J0S1_9RHOB|nr:DUF3824 domain-containing protein [Palleronia pelagia]SEN74473.1 Domain of unknwon function [Palleronia pelagia]